MTTTKRGRVNLYNKQTYTHLHKAHQLGVSYETWKTIIKQVNTKLAEAICEEVTGVSLPARMGTIQVSKRKAFGNKVFYDKVHFCKTGEKIPCLNLHSLGYFYKCMWIRTSEVRFDLKDMYRFKSCRALNRNLAKHIKSGKDYLPMQ